MTNNINNLDNLLYLISENRKLYYYAPEDSEILDPIKEAIREIEGLAYGYLYKVRNKPYFLWDTNIFVYEDKFNDIPDNSYRFGRFIYNDNRKEAIELLPITHENLVNFVGKTKADEVVAECFERYQKEIDEIAEHEARLKRIELEELRKAEELNQKLLKVFGFGKVEQKANHSDRFGVRYNYTFFFPRKMTKEEVTMYADMIGLKTIPGCTDDSTYPGEEDSAYPEEIGIREIPWHGENVWEYYRAVYIL